MHGLVLMGQSARGVAERGFGRLGRAPGRPTVRPSVARFHPTDGYILGCAGLIVAYYAAAHLGYALRFSGPVASIVWLPAGVGIAGLYLLGPRAWPAVVVGDLLVNNYSTLPLGAAVGQTFGNLLEMVIGAMLLRRFAARNAPLTTTAGVVGVFAALMAGTVVSATIGTVSLRAGHVVTAGSLGHVWRTWWLGDFSGAMIVVPLALAFAHPAPRLALRSRAREATLVLVTLVILSTIAVSGGSPLSYLAFPALIWAALRFGPRGATLAMMISAAFTIWGTTHSVGPFALVSINDSLLEAQIYLVVAALTALAVAALASERERLAESVRASRARIVAAADEERRRLDRNLHDGAQGHLVVLGVRLAQAAQQTREDPAAAAASLESARGDLMAAIEELRELVGGLHPAALREFGLASAVESVASRSAIPVELIEFPRGRVDESAEVTAYYVILEAVTNAQRHAHASTVRVRGSLGRDSLSVAIEDDGVGGAAERHGGGLQGLRDRVEATGGNLTVDSTLGRGTRITARIPATIAG